MQVYTIPPAYLREAVENLSPDEYPFLATHGGGRTYVQGSSREHAALASRYLGLRAVIAKDFARIHWQNLIDFGILPLTFEDAADYDHVDSVDVLKFSSLPDRLRRGNKITFQDFTKKRNIIALHDLSVRQVDVLLADGLINWLKS